MSQITPSILNALRDCASFRDGSYFWKQKTMQKAVALGLAEKRYVGYSRDTAFVLTPAGRAALAEKDA